MKLENILNKREYQKFYAWAVFLAVLGIGIFFFVIIGQTFNSDDTTTALNLPAPSNPIETTNVLPSNNQNRILANGTVLRKNYIYLNGQGTLTIKNGNAEDSVLKLISATGGKLAYYVYISANSVFTIDNISDGTYRVLYETGADWDGSDFTRNQSYSAFEDALDYGTDETTYTTYTISISPEINGNAQTDNVDPSTFYQY
jgi:hypothetical protein